MNLKLNWGKQIIRHLRRYRKAVDTTLEEISFFVSIVFKM